MAKFKINWTFVGHTTIEAKDAREAQKKFEAMSATRLFNPKPTSPYGHPDCGWDFTQDGDPAQVGE